MSESSIRNENTRYSWTNKVSVYLRFCMSIEQIFDVIKICDLAKLKICAFDYKLFSFI